jgi:CHASE3 domain sensor protein
MDQHLSIKEELKILRWLTSDNPVQQRNLDEMDKIVDEKLDYMNYVLTLSESQGISVYPQLHRSCVLSVENRCWTISTTK